jgi:hypothetical protein
MPLQCGQNKKGKTEIEKNRRKQNKTNLNEKKEEIIKSEVIVRSK